MSELEAFEKLCALMGFYSEVKKIGPEKMGVLFEVPCLLLRGWSTILSSVQYRDWG